VIDSPRTGASARDAQGPRARPEKGLPRDPERLGVPRRSREKAKLTLDPATAEELERMVAEAFALDPALLAKLKDALYQ
jgi:hypothetical protein